MPAPVDSSSSDRLTRHGVLLLAVAVFTVVVAAVTWQLRSFLRGQILQREADMLAAVASMQLENADDELPGALLVAVLKTQKLAGVTALGIFDAQRQLSYTWMLPRSGESPEPGVWKRISQGETIGRLHRHLSNEQRADLLLDPASDSVFEVWVPLRPQRSGALIGAAQFWKDGHDITERFSANDRQLWIQAAVAWLAGSALIVAALAWGFRRIDATNRELRLRSEDLQRANRELVLAAKTSALGTVAAHLMHEIKNPLAGLELIVAGQGETAGRTGDRAGGELAAASELTRRLRTMVNDVVGVLRDEQNGADFELTCADVVEVVQAKVRPEAEQRGVQIDASGASDLSLPGRRANLVTLVLRNLVQNGLEASPPGGVIRLVGRAGGQGKVEFLVEDRGGGLPESVRERLFQPCPSTKVGGSGLGLALSHQLAQQAGGRLELVRSDRGGTCFRLVLSPEA